MPLDKHTRDELKLALMKLESARERLKMDSTTEAYMAEREVLNAILSVNEILHPDSHDRRRN